MKARNIFIVGKTGSGKSVKARRLIAGENRLVVFDTMGEYTDGVILDGYEELKRFWLKCYKGNFRLIYRPYDEQTEFTQVCDLVYLCGNVCFLVEECDLFFRPNAANIEARNILRRGRHRGVKFIGITQRPVQIDRNITAQATEAYIFKVDEPRDIDYLKARFGDEIESLIQGLKPFEYVYIDAAGTKSIGKEEL